MGQNRQQYWIHGNGLSSKSLPKGVLGDDLYGHGDNNWNLGKYSIKRLTQLFIQKIPFEAHVVGHFHNLRFLLENNGPISFNIYC